MITFNGVDLETFGVCGEPSITTSPYEPDTRDAPAFNGVRFVGTHIGAGAVSFKMAIVGTEEERRLKLSQLAEVLNVEEPSQLVLPDSPYWYYLAIPDNGFTPERHIDGDIVDVSFMLTDPVAYGLKKWVDIPAGGSVTFTVGGTYKTYPYFSNITQSPDSTTKSWGLKLDNSETFVLYYGTTANRSIRADFGERLAFIANTLAIPTLESDWFYLTPGEHTISNHLGGSNTLRLLWRERWL